MIFYQFLLFPLTLNLNNHLFCCVAFIKLWLRDNFKYTKRKFIIIIIIIIIIISSLCNFQVFCFKMAFKILYRPVYLSNYFIVTSGSKFVVRMFVSLMHL